MKKHENHEKNMKNHEKNMKNHDFFKKNDRLRIIFFFHFRISLSLLKIYFFILKNI